MNKPSKLDKIRKSTKGLGRNMQPSKLDEILDNFYKDSKVVAVGLPIKPYIVAKSQILALIEEVIGPDTEPKKIGLWNIAIVELENNLRAEMRLRKDNL